MNDPILDIAMTRRTLSESESLLPWADEQAKHAKRVVVVVCVSCVALAYLLMVAA